MMRTSESGHYAAGDRHTCRQPLPYLAHVKGLGAALPHRKIIKSPVARTLSVLRREANRSAVRSGLRAGTVVVRDALLGERSSGPRQRHGDGAQCDAAGQRQAKHKLGEREFHCRLHIHSPLLFRAPPK